MYKYSFLVTSYILLTYIFMYFIRLSYLMTYTNTFLSLYVLLVLYHTVLSPIGVQNLDLFFNTLRYPSCPNYLPFYHFLIQIHTYKHSLAWTGDIYPKVYMHETRYNIYPKVHYGTEQRRACPRNRSVETLAGVLKHSSCIRA